MGLKTSYNQHTTTYLIIGVILIGGIGYYIYKQGQKNNPNAQAVLPSPISATGTDSNSNLETIATAIYNDATGINWFDDHNEDPYNQAQALDDNGFVQMWNIWNSLYQSKTNETLTKYIQDQSSIAFTAWDTAKTAFLNRCASLNLS